MLENWLNTKQGQVFHYKMEKIEYALELLGNPQFAVPVIHVAGTNGKGSTIAFMRQLFQTHSLRVGSFVSPHMVSVHDRICIDSQPISDHDFQRYLQKVYDLEQEVATRYEPFRYFEVMVLIMFLYFEAQQPDVALVEVGIGGLLDTTNVVAPALSVITSIGMDHQDLLGSTLGEIAEQKAGIIKESVPVVLGPLCPETTAICRHIAQDKQASVYQFCQEFTYKAGHFSNTDIDLSELVLGLAGHYQEENAAVALQTFLLYMTNIQKDIQPQLIQQALAQTSWPGRLELVVQEPKIYLDGAHNVPAIERLLEFIQVQDEPVTILFSALRRKDFQEMLGLLEERLPHTALVLTSFAYDGALSEENRQGRDYVENYQQFIEDWQSSRQGILIVTGSLYFISEVRRIFKK
ncbi:TPA: bifunctional folylpolyglutamate synthase/dihydrofolate synthase [Streptococcus suis 2524]|uniref:bifunctional folylpolyglutamate synthase/dihydrofolate synthase n=1 Tax=Streptococcus suis TaxID=1307 RepID=UPI00041640F5|nr:folylpolyglutamate synthase/dihydrofolate synthase family protein [Streptococcus suis]RRR31523.1 bifunctional folylpolyglutamate synthase/dihydrofolate synthase [Streptococcus suis]RRR38362.1 bifunctional folylpolyglutamate synthase/dihydrofolate synthase [Streptococcus suis]RRR53772.1 bifunctional folylpolyglutamate synthase/dihydrofolate synthase [Streptococcus suis]RRR59150.1 bifunctional folylpolyglutamate synthase/dihydrofolate synthase [Streptococcus suis]HEM3217102.1 bifunctional fol